MREVTYSTLSAGRRGRRRLFALTLLASMLAGPALVSAQAQEPSAVAQKQLIPEAVAVLEGLLAEAKLYEDKALQIRVEARVAGALWPVDADRARDLFVKAFDKIESLEGDAGRRYNVLSEVVAIARQRDAKMAEQLIARLKRKDGEKGKSEDGLLSRGPGEQISQQGALYVDSARNLLAEGKKEEAMSFAQHSLGQGRSGQFIAFLYELRERDRAAADRFFLQSLKLLERREADPNDVLYLGLHVFYPGVISSGALSDGVVAVGVGLNFSAAPSPQLDLVVPYLNAAAVTFANYQVSPSLMVPGRSIELKRYALQQLLPLYQRHLPERAGAMLYELQALGPPKPGAPNSPEQGRPTIPLHETLSTSELLEKIASLPAEKRDGYLLEAAKAAVDAGDLERAEALTARVGDSKLKQNLNHLIAYNAARVAVERGNLDEAVRIANSRLEREWRAVIFNQVAAAWLKQDNFQQSDQLINAASAEAAKTEDRRTRALIYIYLAAGVVKRNAPRAFELMRAAVKDINSLESFDPFDNQLRLEAVTARGEGYSFTFSAGASLLSVVSRLAPADYAETQALTRSIQSPQTRAFATITASRAILNLGGAASQKQPEAAKPAPPKPD